MRGIGSTFADILTGTGHVSRDAQNQAEANWENKREEYRIISEELRNNQYQEWHSASQQEYFQSELLNNQTGAALGALKDEVSGQREEKLREEKLDKAREREARIPTATALRNRTILENRIRTQTAPSRSQEYEQER